MDRAGRFVPLAEAEAGASERARAPAPRRAANCTDLSEFGYPIEFFGGYQRGMAAGKKGSQATGCEDKREARLSGYRRFR